MRLKRAFDIVFASVALVALSPLLLVLTLLVRLDGGPALYRGVRVGRDGRLFRLKKFRTMVVDADRLGSNSTAQDDSRITQIGRFLRRHKLDELPQLLNVVTGEMSLVGPRPQIPEDVALYTDEERALLSVPPGITDYASIRFRNEGQILMGTDDPDEAYVQLIRPEKIELGLLYVRTRSFAVDLKILALTVIALFNHQAAVRALPGART